MKRFNLEEYKKDPSREITNFNYDKIRIICTDRDSFAGDMVLSLVSTITGEVVVSHYPNGIATIGNTFDLFFETEKKTKWINI